MQSWEVPCGGGGTEEAKGILGPIVEFLTDDARAGGSIAICGIAIITAVHEAGVAIVRRVIGVAGVLAAAKILRLLIVAA